jgi:hypothetical protein
MKLVPATGFEPATLGLKDRCSAKLSYAGADTNLGVGRLPVRTTDCGSLPPGEIQHDHRQGTAHCLSP